MRPTAIVEDGNNGANYGVTLLVNNEGIITDAALPAPLPTDAGLGLTYRSVVSWMRSRLDGDWYGNIAMLRIAEVARRTFGTLSVTDSSPGNTVGLLRVRSIVAVPTVGPQTPLAPGQTFTNGYSDGSVSTTTLVQVDPGTRMRVSETSLNVSEQLALAAGDSAAGAITVSGEGSDLVVSMDATVPAPSQGEGRPVGVAGAQVGVSMAGVPAIKWGSR